MCTPSKKDIHTQACGFSNLPQQTITLEEIPSLSVAEKSFTHINFEHLEEFSDYLKFKTLTLPRGTVLCHSAYSKDFYDKDKGVNLDTIYWWNEYFPGQSAYKGGWFTYETSYGGPNFGLNLYYRLQDDLTLPFIPNDFADKYLQSDPRYFSEKSLMSNKRSILRNLLFSLKNNSPDTDAYMIKFVNIVSSSLDEFKVQKLVQQALDNLILYDSLKNPLQNLLDKYTDQEEEDEDDLSLYSKIYSGSHILEGVQDWEVKGYKVLAHPISSYADNLAIRLADLGFNGYISCDECEVYITHTAMQRVLTKPFTFDLDPKKILSQEMLPLSQLIEGGFKFPHIPLTVTKTIKRNKFNRIYAQTEDFLSHLKNPEKFI